jgi:hypothetical protein
MIVPMRIGVPDRLKSPQAVDTPRVGQTQAPPDDPSF